MILTKDYIYSLYVTFKARAAKAVERGHYDTALKYLSAAAHTAYTFYIGFRDDEIETLLRRISENIAKRTFRVASPDRVVMYDTFSQDSQGLTMQYIDAIIAAGWELLYITEFNLDDPRSRLIKCTLQSYDKAQVVFVPSGIDGMKRVQFIYDNIIGYGALRLFMQISPSACCAVTAFYSLPRDITRYQINLTDHTYWVGAGCMDYIFEFRPYGASISVGQRRFEENQVLLLPYYPMTKETPFEGFPQESEGKVKIFSGASFYKISDDGDTFLKISKAILDTNPEAVILFASGRDSKILNKKIIQYNLQGKFILLGYRNDIYQCYKHSDIFLSTYPMYSALMGQLAAHAGLPILALQKLGSGNVEEVVCQKKFERITFSNMKELVIEATNLIRNADYRERKGKLIREMVINADEFNRNFVEIINNNISTSYLLKVNKDIEPRCVDIESKLNLVNGNKGFQLGLFIDMGFSLLFVAPMLWLDGFICRVKGSRLFK